MGVCKGRDECEYYKYFLTNSRYRPRCKNCKIRKQMTKDKQEKLPEWYKELCEPCYNEMTRKDAPML